MNAQLLLAHFNRISDAPDAIPRLRRFIVDLAVRGKLVEPDPADEPASELLNKIRAEKAQLVKQGNIQQRGQSASTATDLPLVVMPQGWVLTTLGEIAHKITDGAHKTPTYVDRGVPFISVKDFSGGKLDFSHTRLISPQEHATLFKRCDPRRGDILICRIGTLGKAVLVDTDREFSLFVSVGLIRFSQNFIAPLFFRLLLNSPLLESEYNRIKVGGGTHTNKLNLGDLHTVVFPLPPLAEQYRIVVKVDELMELCDRLQASRDEQEHRRHRLATLSLHSLSNGSTPAESQNNARFYLDHLRQLTIRPQQIPVLRQAVLNLAIRGQIAAQDPDDESSATLLVQNDQTRQNIAKKDRRADAERQVLLASESRWNVPPSWDWCALADLVLFIDYRGKTPTKTGQGVRLITAKNVKKGFINISPEEFLSERDYHTWMTRGFPRVGDILFTTEAPMGNAAVVRLSERFALAQRVICFRPYGAVNPDFLALQLLAEPFLSILEKTATGLTAKGIKAAKLKRLPIAVPPLAEQLRIVARVNELMALCDKLEAQLATAQTETSRLLESVLHHALTSLGGISDVGAPTTETSLHSALIHTNMLT
jgi:type I restriction enzyme S subunit